MIVEEKTPLGSMKPERLAELASSHARMLGLRLVITSELHEGTWKYRVDGATGRSVLVPMHLRADGTIASRTVQEIGQVVRWFAGFPR